MADRSAQGMTREKLVCCCALVSLAACALVIGLAQSYPQSLVGSIYSEIFGSAPPEHLSGQAPVTGISPPPEYYVNETPPVPGPGDLSRATPFAPPKEHIVTSSGWWRSLTRLTTWTVFPPGVQVAQPQPGQPSRPSPTLLDGSSPVAYMGVLGVLGQRYGMLRVKNGQFLNVREGDCLTDLGCTIVRVEKEAIHLLTRTGVYHILRRTGS